jgi:catechol 2,3-dioxygenase-like lactoylglutathione lyase family enzyme
MKYICSMLVVSDIKRSRNFYENLLNQKVIHDFGENVAFDGFFSIHLKSHFQKLINKEIFSGTNNCELYFEEDDLENFVKLLENNNITIAHPLIEQPWRQKAVRFYDPDNYLIEVGESMEHLCLRLSQEGLSNDKINKTTGLPIEFINLVIK